MVLGKERILEIERGSTISHSMEKWLWKRLWTFRKIEKNEIVNIRLLILPEKSAKIDTHTVGCELSFVS